MFLWLDGTLLPFMVAFALYSGCAEVLARGLSNQMVSQRALLAAAGSKFDNGGAGGGIYLQNAGDLCHETSIDAGYFRYAFNP